MRRDLCLVCLEAAAFAAAARASADTSVCAPCHARQARTHAATSMARTLASGPEAEILRANPDLTFRDGAYTYAIRRDGQSIDYSVSDGKQTVSAPVAWAFGLGAAGQTYVFERDGHRYESRVSFFRDIGGLGLTLGARNASPRNINPALERGPAAPDRTGGPGGLFRYLHSAGGPDARARLRRPA